MFSLLLDDFNETCPLLEMMANKSMKLRHWERIANVTGHKFDVESDNFLLRDIMTAPLLQYKEEIEVNTINKKKYFKIIFSSNLRIFVYRL